MVKSQNFSHKCSPSPSSEGFLGVKRFKGVRMRSWGKWVSEIRIPNTRARLWLGSYSTPEEAARAYDVALVCLRGPSVSLNFPDSPPKICSECLSPKEIQELAVATAVSYGSKTCLLVDCSHGSSWDKELSTNSSCSSFPITPGSNSDEDLLPKRTIEDDSSLRLHSSTSNRMSWGGSDEDTSSLAEDLHIKASEKITPDSENLKATSAPQCLQDVEGWNAYALFISNPICAEPPFGDSPILPDVSYWEFLTNSGSVFPVDRDEEESFVFTEPYLWSS